MVELGSVCEKITDGSHFSPETTVDGYPYVTVKDLNHGHIDFDGCKRIDEESYRQLANNGCKPRPGDVLFSKDGTVGKTAMVASDRDFVVLSSLAIITADAKRALPEYVHCVLSSQHFIDLAVGRKTGVAIRRIVLRTLKTIQIPLPPLDVQRVISTEIASYRKVIEGALVVLENYRPELPFDPAWPEIELREVITEKPRNGYSGRPVSHVTNVKVLSLTATTSGVLDPTKFKYLDEDIPLDAPCRCRGGDIYLQRGNTAELVGTAAMFDLDDECFIYPDLMIRVRADESRVHTEYLVLALHSGPVRAFLQRNAVGAAGSMPKINQRIVERIPLRLPPLSTQRAIVSEIQAEERLVATNRDLIARFDAKIKTALGRVWGEASSDS